MKHSNLTANDLINLVEAWYDILIENNLTYLLVIE